MATNISEAEIIARADALRDSEPDPFVALAEDVGPHILAVRETLEALTAAENSLQGAGINYVREAASRQVRFARARLDHDRKPALEILTTLFRLGTLPQPDGRYEGELIGLSTGLLSDPFFEWLGRMYLPWLGKTFYLQDASGDNIFTDNAWSKATGKIGWPEYRLHDDKFPDTVRVFPFKTEEGAAVEDDGLSVLRLFYADAPNPLPVRRVVDELVELPGGYLLGKAHMRGLREFRRVCFFGLLPRE